MTTQQLQDELMKLGFVKVEVVAAKQSHGANIVIKIYKDLNSFNTVTLTVYSAPDNCGLMLLNGYNEIHNFIFLISQREVAFACLKQHVNRLFFVERIVTFLENYAITNIDTSKNILYGALALSTNTTGDEDEDDEYKEHEISSSGEATKALFEEVWANRQKAGVETSCTTTSFVNKNSDNFQMLFVTNGCEGVTEMGQLTDYVIIPTHSPKDWESWNAQTCFGDNENIYRFVSKTDKVTILQRVIGRKANQPVINVEVELETALKMKITPIIFAQKQNAFLQEQERVKVATEDINALINNNISYFEKRGVMTALDYKEHCWRVSDMRNLKLGETLLIDDTTKAVVLPVDYDIEKNMITVKVLTGNQKTYITEKHRFYKLKK